MNYDATKKTRQVSKQTNILPRETIFSAFIIITSKQALINQSRMVCACVRFRKSSALIIQQVDLVDSPGKRDLPSVAERIKFYHQRTSPQPTLSPTAKFVCLPRTQAVRLLLQCLFLILIIIKKNILII